MNISFHKIAGHSAYAVFGDNEMVGTIDCPLERKWRVKMGSLERDGFSSAGKARAWIEGYVYAVTIRKLGDQQT